MPETTPRRSGARRSAASAKTEPAKQTLTLAVPKGRVLAQLAPLLRSIHVDTTDVLADDRRLIREDPRWGDEGQTHGRADDERHQRSDQCHQ